MAKLFPNTPAGKKSSAKNHLSTFHQIFEQFRQHPPNQNDVAKTILHKLIT